VRNDLNDLINVLDRLGSSLVVSGPARVARKTIRELQQEGPSWTGRFSNSWQLETDDGRLYRGDGGPGDPRDINIPVGVFTGRQNVRGVLPIKDRAIATISNFSDYAAQATDLEEGIFIRDWAEPPSDKPQTALGKSKFYEEDSGRKFPSFRGDPGGGNPLSVSGTTAELDWFADYVRGGRLDRTLRVEMDGLLQEFR
jgi:hypothetical protein